MHNGTAAAADERIARIVGPDHVSDRLSVFSVEQEGPHVIGGRFIRRGRGGVRGADRP